MKTLKQLRHERLMTLNQLAVYGDVSYGTVQSAENKKHVPTLRTIRNLCTALGVAPCEVAEFAAALAAREQGQQAA